MNKELITTVLVDFDGTIGNTLPVWNEAIQSGLQAINFTDKYAQVLSETDICHVLLPRLSNIKEYGVDNKDTQYFIDSVVFRAMANLINAPLQKNAVHFLDRLKQLQIPTALVTSAESEQLNPILEKYHLHDYFQATITRNDVTQHKPNPEALLVALSHLNVAASEQVVMIGDNLVDIQAAEAAHVSGILYYPPHHQSLYAYGSETLESLDVASDLLDIIE
jgi:HAD superfamily hydrolase (TIGR01509 family)